MRFTISSRRRRCRPANAERLKTLAKGGPEVKLDDLRDDLHIAKHYLYLVKY